MCDVCPDFVSRSANKQKAFVINETENSSGQVHQVAFDGSFAAAAIVGHNLQNHAIFLQTNFIDWGPEIWQAKCILVAANRY